MVTRTEARVGDRVIGKSDMPDLGAAIQNALPREPADLTVVIQADQDVPYDVIRQVVQAAKKTGHTNVLFAVKKR